MGMEQLYEFRIYHSVINRQCAHIQSYLSGGANVPDDTVP